MLWHKDDIKLNAVDYNSRRKDQKREFIRCHETCNFFYAGKKSHQCGIENEKLPEQNKFGMQKK